MKPTPRSNPDARVDGCAHTTVRCSLCGTDLIGCTHEGGMQLTPGQRNTLAGLHTKRARKRSLWKRIFGEVDSDAYWQGRG